MIEGGRWKVDIVMGRGKRAMVRAVCGRTQLVEDAAVPVMAGRNSRQRGACQAGLLASRTLT